MKTERRRELQTNELAQQIDNVSDYVRKNAGQLLIGGGAALVIVLGAYWFISSKRAEVMSGWTTLSDSALAADPSGAILRYKEVANSTTDQDLALAAWNRIGEVAMGQLIAADAATAGATDWQKTAEEAYSKVIASAGAEDVTARGQAIILLGVLAENEGDYARAREQYKKVAESESFKQTPLPQQAEFRLANLDRWSEPVNFPPAAVTVPVPQPTASTPGVPPGQELIMSQTVDLKSGQAVSTDGTTTPVKITPIDAPPAAPDTPASTPPPTTQPAE